MNPPNIPQLSRNPEDVQDDIETIIGYLYDLNSFLADGEHDPAWTVTGITEDKVLASGDTLAQVIDVLGTLINTLSDKGLI